MSNRPGLTLDNYIAESLLSCPTPGQLDSTGLCTPFVMQSSGYQNPANTLPGSVLSLPVHYSRFYQNVKPDLQVARHIDPKWIL